LVGLDASGQGSNAGQDDATRPDEGSVWRAVTARDHGVGSRDAQREVRSGQSDAIDAQETVRPDDGAQFLPSCVSCAVPAGGAGGVRTPPRDAVPAHLSGPGAYVARSPNVAPLSALAGPSTAARKYARAYASACVRLKFVMGTSTQKMRPAEYSFPLLGPVECARGGGSS